MASTEIKPPVSPPKKFVKALFDLQATQEGQLPLIKGNDIILVEKTSAEWWRGTYYGQQIGSFPSNYVQELNPQEPFEGVEIAVALYDYTPLESYDLSFKTGALLIVAAKPLTDWWWGEDLNGKLGVFPTTYVATLIDTRIYPIEESKVEPVAKPISVAGATYDYTANGDNELSLRKGDVVKIFEKLDTGWWKGEIDGKIGFFPGDFVDEMEGDELKNMLPPPPPAFSLSGPPKMSLPTPPQATKMKNVPLSYHHGSNLQLLIYRHLPSQLMKNK